MKKVQKMEIPEFYRSVIRDVTEKSKEFVPDSVAEKISKVKLPSFFFFLLMQENLHRFGR